MAKFFAKNHCVNGKCFVFIHKVFPTNGLDLLIYLISILCGKMFDGFEDANSCAETEICFIHHSLVTCKGDHASANLYIICSEYS